MSTQLRPAVGIGAELNIGGSCSWKSAHHGLDLSGNCNLFAGATASASGKLSAGLYQGINASISVAASPGSRPRLRENVRSPTTASPWSALKPRRRCSSAWGDLWVAVSRFQYLTRRRLAFRHPRRSGSESACQPKQKSISSKSTWQEGTTSENLYIFPPSLRATGL